MDKGAATASTGGAVGDTVGGGGGDGGGVGPAGVNSGGANEVVGHIYRDDVSSPCVGGENFARGCSTKSQPFDIFSSPYFKSPGLMASSVEFPFTSDQWKELERQAMIYKYMISSVPVPTHLLFPSAPSLVYNAGYSRNGDLEPGRCKRTDGKKWRCAREVAPNQKYCERHLHRGRPRSRKPVEVKNNGESHKRTRILPNSTTVSQPRNDQQPPVLFSSETNPSIKRVSRDLSLMEGEMVALDGAEQQWPRLVEQGNVGFPNEGSSSIYGSSTLLHQDYVDQMPMNALPYSNFFTPEIDHTPIGFIDAWSADNNLSSNNNVDNSEYSLLANHPSLDLSIAMAAGNFVDAQMGHVQFGAGVKCCDNEKSSVSWEPFARGGPLAEALQSGSVCTNPASPHDSMNTPPATTVSSPSGVLHRTLFSHSDGSVCNSPTFAVHTSEGAAFHRLN